MQQVLITDLERVGQTAAGAAGVTHSVQGFTGEPCGTLYQAADFHVCHLGGHQARGDALGKDMVGQVELRFTSPF